MGLKVGGVLGTPVLVDGEKIGNDIVDLVTDESALLCRIKSCADYEGEETDNYVLSGKGMEFGKKAIRAAADCDLIVIDEVGVLELSGSGFMDEVRMAIESGNDTLLVIKSKHIARFRQIFQGQEFREIRA